MQNILKMDRETCGGIQMELTAPIMPEEIPKDEPHLDSRFAGEIAHRSLGGHVAQKLEASYTNKDFVSYTVSTQFDNLIGLKAVINLIPIKVKDKYKRHVEICYHHNIGHNILYEGECLINKKHYAYVDSCYSDMHSQMLADISSDNERRLYARRIGAIPCLERWNTYLPGLPLSPPQAFHFAKDTRVSIPILKGESKITFEYKTRLRIVDLLRMRVKVTPKDGSEPYYTETKVKMKYLDIRGKLTEIPVPELWGRYSDMSDPERNWRKSVNKKTGEPTRQIIYYEDIDKLSSKNEISSGAQVEIKLVGTGAAKHVLWVAQHKDAGLSNYTTNKDNVYEGWNPCVKSGMYYSTAERVPDLSHEHHSIDIMTDLKWPTTPTEEGYNAHTYNFVPKNINTCDTAVVLKECGASLVVRIGNSDPFLHENCDDEEDADVSGDNSIESIPIEAVEESRSDVKDKFMLHVRMIVIRKMEVYWSDKSNSLEYIITSE